jgi:hypothetical protein
MRCLACDSNLSDFESTRKGTNTNEYMDLCNKCFREIQPDLNSEVRIDLKHDQDVIDE